MSDEFYNPKNPDLFKQIELIPEPAEEPNIDSKIKGLSILSFGDFISPNFKAGRSGFRISSNGDVEFNGGIFRGQLIAGSIDIPDETSADSFHVDSSGNTWWGAATLASSRASVTKEGRATFRGVSTLEVQLSTVFESSARFSSFTGGSGSRTFTNSGALIATGTTTSSYSNLQLIIYPNAVNLNTAEIGFSTVVFVDNDETLGGVGSAFWGIGSYAIDGSGHVDSGSYAIGFMIKKTGGAASLYVVAINNGTKTETLLYSPVYQSMVLDLIFKVNSDSSSVSFYYRVNAGSLSSPTTITTNIPTVVNPYLQTSTSNDNTAFDNSFRTLSASYRR